MAEANSKVEEIISSVNSLIVKLDENEANYKRLKVEYTNKIQSDLNELALLPDARKSLSDIFSHLYWNTNISAKQPSNDSSSDSSDNVSLVRPLFLEFPCKEGCGNTVKEKFSSKANLAYFKRNNRAQYSQCHDCRRKSDLESTQRNADYEQRNQQKYAQEKEREKKLSEMKWADFIETPEWIEIRNSCFSDHHGSCEMCKADSVTLYLYPHKDTPQSKKGQYYNENYKYYLVCKDCIKRCKGLVDNKKRDVIKTEIFPVIREWAQEVEYGLWD